MSRWECQVVGDELWEKVTADLLNEALNIFARQVYDEGGFGDGDEIDVVIRNDGSTEGTHFSVRCEVRPSFDINYVAAIENTEA